MCKHEMFIKSLGEPQTNREYWIMTEIFVYLHNGKDVCDCENLSSGHMILGLIKDQVGSGTFKLVKEELNGIERCYAQNAPSSSECQHEYDYVNTTPFIGHKCKKCGHCI